MRTPRALGLVTAAVLAIGLTACSTPAAQSDGPDAGGPRPGPDGGPAPDPDTLEP